MISRRLIEAWPVTRMWRRIEMNFTYRGIIGGDSTMQINIWRRGKKHVAVFDEELPVRPQRRTNRESLSTGHLKRSSRPNGKQCHHFTAGRQLDELQRNFTEKRDGTDSKANPAHLPNVSVLCARKHPCRRYPGSIDNYGAFMICRCLRQFAGGTFRCVSWRKR
jgi:hypothetical protein